MFKKLNLNRSDIFKLAVTGALYLAAIIVFAVFDIDSRIELAVYIIIYIAVGAKTVIEAFSDFLKEPFNENFLMLVASVGAFILGEYAEAVAVMYFFSVGEFFEEYAEKKSESAIEKLYGMLSDAATLLTENGNITVDVASVRAGDVLFIKAGERSCADGELLDECKYFDTSMITGESKPKKILKGETVRSGYIAVGSSATVKALCTAENSSAAKIIELIKESGEKKAKSEKFITEFAKVYTPVVIALSLAVAFLPLAFGGELAVWAKRALNLLVISCPCALVVSVPIAFFAGVGRAFSKGIIVKGSVAMENVDKSKVYAFDKTGTLTKGSFTIKKVFPKEKSDLILKISKSLEIHSAHPIARAIVNADTGELFAATEVSEIAGNGLIGKLSGEKACVGKASFVENNGFKIVKAKEFGTVIYVAMGEISGYVVIGDEVKDGAKELISYLNKDGKTTVVLSGDNGGCVKHVAEQLGVKEYKGELMPADKVEYVEKLKKSGKTLFVGDGVNDAPVIASADVSVAMGSGSDVASDCADVVICDDDIAKIAALKKISKKTIGVVKTNIAGSIGVKALIFILSVLGFAPLYLAIIADVGVMMLATLNSLRLAIGKTL